MSRAWLGGLAGLAIVAALAAGTPAVISARLAGGTAPTQSYRLIGAHAMLTRERYAARLRGTDYTPLGSVPVGGKMIYGGGPVLVKPKVFITYWDWSSDPQGVQPYLNGFFGGVGGSDWIASQSQYCEHVQTTAVSCAGGDMVTSPPDQLGGVWNDTQDQVPANPIAEPATGNSPPIAEEALRSVAHFGYVQDGLYVIATPHDISTAGFAGNPGGSYCAWHGAVQLADGSRVQFVNLPYVLDIGSSCGANSVNPGSDGDLDGVSMVAGHEYAEAITDPTVSFSGLAAQGVTATGWYDPDPVLGGETGDKCAYPLGNRFGVADSGNSTDIWLGGKRYAVQPLWSNNANNNAGGCVTSYTPPAVELPALPTLPGSAPVNGSPAVCHGAQISDAAGDAVDPYTTLNVASTNQPALDILNVRFSTPDPKTLEIATAVDDLQPFPQGEVLGGAWSVYWDYGGTTYVASTFADATGVVYEDGTHTSLGDSFTNTNDTGSFNPGPNGTVVIDVPLANVGGPAAGAVLSKPWAVSYGTLGNTAGSSLITFGSDEAPDDNPYLGGPYTGWPYTVGASSSCDTLRKLPPPPVDTAPPPPPGPPVTVGVCSGDNVITGASGDVHNPVPDAPTGANLGTADITGVSFAVDGGAGTLTTTLTIAGLNQAPIVGTTTTYYNVIFGLPDGRLYATQVVLPDPAGTSFAAGLWNPTNNRFVSSTSETGSVNMGSPGTVVVVAKLADLGNPSPSASPLITRPYADTTSGERVLGQGLTYNTPDDRAPKRDSGPAWPICAPPAVTVLPVTVDAGQRFAGPVATFVDRQTSFPSAGDLGATIAWGDGTTSAGTLTGRGTQFTLSGSHTYSSGGSYVLGVTVQQRSGSSGTLATSQRQVSVAGASAATGAAPASQAGAAGPAAASPAKGPAPAPKQPAPLVSAPTHLQGGAVARPPAAPLWVSIGAAVLVALVALGVLGYRRLRALR